MGKRYFLDKWKLLNGDRLMSKVVVPEDFDYIGYFFIEDSEGTSYRLWGPVKRIDRPEGGEIQALVRDESGRVISNIHQLDRKLFLPFNPDHILEGLLQERYLRPRPLLSIVSRFYYMAKPLMPVALQIMLRTTFYRLKRIQSTFPSWPFDDRLHKFELYILKLLLLTGGLNKQPFVWFWPRGYQFTLLLTHDVESSSGARNVRKIIELEKSHGFRSSFNFVTNKYEVPGELIEFIKKEGFEVGVHGYKHDGKLFCNYTVFKARIRKIAERAEEWNAVGFRSPSTLRKLDWLQEIPFIYDSSFFDTDPYEPQPGGTLSFFPFRLGDLVELPMTLPQDHILFRYLGEKSPRVWLNKVIQLKSNHGLALLNTHPDKGYLGEPRNFLIYEEFLKSLKQIGGFWNPLPRELAEWWLKRAAIDVDNSSKAVLPEEAAWALLDIQNGCLSIDLNPSPLHYDT